MNYRNIFMYILTSFVIFLNAPGVHADSLTRKFAETKMIGCEESDIVLGTRVWAACNYYYNFTASIYYNGMNQNAVDVNGWNYGQLYLHTYATCPSGYKIPSLSDFTGSIKTLNDIFVLQLPAAGIYQSYSANKYTGINLKGTYLVSNYRLEKDRAGQPDRQFYGFNLNNQSFGIVHDNTAEAGDIKTSLRCIRIAPATQEERIGKLVVKQDHQETPNYGLSTNEDFEISTNQNFSTLSESISSDPYVNEKMKEIHACFEESYSGQLSNIDTSITKVIEESKNGDMARKKKYEEVLTKLTMIRKMYLEKYGPLFGERVTTTPMSSPKENNLIFSNDKLLDTKDLSYKIKFNPQDINHTYAILIILSDLHKRGYDINVLYSNIDSVYTRKTKKSLNTHAVNLKSKLKNKVISEKLQNIKDELEGIHDGQTGENLDGFGFEFGNNKGEGKIGFGDIISSEGNTLTDIITEFEDAINAGRNGFQRGNSNEYNDTYGGGNAGFMNSHSNSMAGGFDEVIGYSTSVKSSENGKYSGSFFQYWSVNSSDGTFRQGSKHSSVDNQGNTTVQERIVFNNTDGSTEVYEGTNRNGVRQGTYTKTDKDGKKVDEKNVGGNSPDSNNSGGNTPGSTDEPTGSINPERDGGTMAPRTFIGLLNLLGKSGFINNFNTGAGAINGGNPDNVSEFGGPLNEVKLNGSWVINWGEDSCPVCSDTIGGINQGAVKSGQWTDPAGR